jgi:hypothetical protein
MEMKTLQTLFTITLALAPTFVPTAAHATWYVLDASPTGPLVSCITSQELANKANSPLLVTPEGALQAMHEKDMAVHVTDQTDISVSIGNDRIAPLIYFTDAKECAISANALVLLKNYKASKAAQQETVHPCEGYKFAQCYSTHALRDTALCADANGIGILVGIHAGAGGGNLSHLKDYGCALVSAGTHGEAQYVGSGGGRAFSVIAAANGAFGVMYPGDWSMDALKAHAR